MAATYSNLFSWHRSARLAALAVVFTFAWVTSARGQILDSELAEPATTTPYSLFQASTITGSTNTIFAGRVATVSSSGAVSYYDVTLQFAVDSTGKLTLASNQIVPSVTLITSKFQAGTYVGPSTVGNGGAIINVSGPGVASGGATEWSLAAGSGAWYYTYPSSATWYVGPLTSNPFYSRIKAAGITSSAWYYGVGGSSCGCNTWEGDSLMGFSQVGNTLTIVSFSKNGTDYNTPQDEITYTKQQ